MLILGNRKFIEAAFDSENELEGVVGKNVELFFGPSSIFLPKTLIQTAEGFGTIPDGFAIDLASQTWFMVEVELAKHGVWDHIAKQVSKQIVAATTAVSRDRLVKLLIEKYQSDAAVREAFEEQNVQEINVCGLVGKILQKEPKVGIPIDAIPKDLSEWANTLRLKVMLWVVRKYIESGHPENVVYQVPEEFSSQVVGTEDSQGTSRGTYPVTVADLVQSGYLSKEQPLFMSWQPHHGPNHNFEAFVKEGGDIRANGTLFSSPTSAARYVLEAAGIPRSVNGWIKWKTTDGISLADLRNQYLAEEHEAGEAG